MMVSCSVKHFGATETDLAGFKVSRQTSSWAGRQFRDNAGNQRARCVAERNRQRSTGLDYPGKEKLQIRHQYDVKIA